MYGIFTYMWLIFRENVGKYSIHGAYGIVVCMFTRGCPPRFDIRRAGRDLPIRELCRNIGAVELRQRASEVWLRYPLVI